MDRGTRDGGCGAIGLRGEFGGTSVLPATSWPHAGDLLPRPGHLFIGVRLQRDPTMANAVTQVRQVYADLAARPIERSCTRVKECCHFKLTGRTPFLTKGEALLAARSLRATGRKRLPESADGVCPLLNRETGNCLVYNDRPFGCRTHFCAAAGGPYARREVIDLIRRLEQIDSDLAGDGTHSLQSAVGDALTALG